MALVKICGILSAEMAEHVAKLEVDYIGFVFARSKRQVSAAQAAEMIRSIRSASPERKVKAAGVFVNPTLEELDAIVSEAPLDVVQLHGQESANYCREVKSRYGAYGIEVIKVFSLSTAGAASVGEEGAVEAEAESDSYESAANKLLEPYRDAVDGVLLDTFDPLYGGGSGKTFAWDAIPPYQAWCREAGVPLLVAGGLLPDNVSGLLEQYRPDGVDVSSGVETDGTKDLSKIITFVERVKSIV
ncbi:phosphoribosylanthranilate isomerase [Paenibacillus sp. YYML68]|uniref:phosphoribosylanthranilate isomerase n=1 Tax=Paenibacillus sp. YYML68 TaxID=2909250 RepID=UPI002490F61F|nr:phosphoribosylanthranilate isomerase [Paenibacillus sp. YYML68]